MNGVSVVIPCFNAERWIGETLHSVFDQKVPGVEVIVVDDGSTDGSARLVERAFPGARLVRTAHAGPSGARNIGTRLASGQYIQYLDADDLLAPAKLEAQVQALEHTGGDVVLGDWTELRQHPDGSFVPARVVKPGIRGEPAIAFLTDVWCPPAAYLFRRCIVDRIGGWDEQQWLIEDVRFVLMCALRGARFTYVPGLAAFYRIHDASLSRSDPGAFQRGCLRNAVTAEEWWLRHGGLTASRKHALVGAYSHVARGSFGCDDVTFESAYAALKRVNPKYVPAGPWHFALASRLIGYRSAEALALRYRRAKHRLAVRLPLGTQ